MFLCWAASNYHVSTGGWMNLFPYYIRFSWFLSYFKMLKKVMKKKIKQKKTLIKKDTNKKSKKDTQKDGSHPK